VVKSSPGAATLEEFERTGAYLRGHFRLTSGLHSPEYLQSARVLQYTESAERFGRELALKLRQIASKPVTVVVSPALGGLIIGHEVARALGVRFIFTERDASGAMTLRRGFQVGPEDVAAVVEDVITTGGSTGEVIEVLRNLGAATTAVGSIIDRSGGSVNLGVPRAALATMQVTAYGEQECPLCRQGLPVEKPGSRKA
jgi:orotate phosphoribosyltransferase